MHAVFVCAQSPLQNSGGGGLAIRLVWCCRDRTLGPGYRGGGEAREAKRGVILSVKLVSWEVESSAQSRRRVSGARVVASADKLFEDRLSKEKDKKTAASKFKFNNGLGASNLTSLYIRMATRL
jgi:hypothetical protein